MYKQHSVSIRTLCFSAIGLLMVSACGDAEDAANLPATAANPIPTAPTTGVGTGGNTGAGGSPASPSTTSGGQVNATDTNTGGQVTSMGGQVSTGGMSTGGQPSASTGGQVNAPDMNTGGQVNAPDMNTGGQVNAPDMNTGGQVNAPDMNTGGQVNQMPAEPPTLCKAMGWATRTGRSGGAFEVTGGGNASPVVVKNFADLQKNAEGSEPRVIHIDGTVGGGWKGKSGDRLEVGSNKTIVGLRPGTELRAPIHIKGSSNVIVRNIVIQGPGSNSDQAWDNINIEGSSKNVWIDHCEFWNGQDGNADVVKGADTVTFTWNIFGYTKGGGHNFSNLVASSDNESQSRGKLNITLMFNHFRGVAQRQPRCRYGDIHVVNNLFTKDGMTSQNGTSAGKECRILTENNHFIGIAKPIHVRDGGTNELRGKNIFDGTSGNTKGFGGQAFEPPYEYKNLLVEASAVKGLLEGNVGATLAGPNACK